ncbi:hypothetical protein VFPFJ_09550 [Purpureocillium lilacinum]|uniref:Uncharacterized protein n=1 Tax=Purpureocillium lilacinum TaxID=33203 RepID=A0A179GT18_PURLI|nr:hypothetical protein VFPFJ_09550 [Purpureocillium lilacinum]OAQ81095.1 hypothetical protein VFPFJ_09550 [Purpureocillium lilacinum]
MRGKRKNDGKYKSEKECLDAHEPNPHEPKPPVQPDTPKPPGQPSAQPAPPTPKPPVQPEPHMPKPSGQAALLPWIDQPTRDEVKASGCFEMATDERCGTELYCNTYDPKIGGKNDGKYSSTKECLDAHKPEPRKPN